MKFKNFLTILSITFLVGFVGLVASPVNVQATPQEEVVVDDNCDHNCPTVEWTHYVCPQGYSEHGDNCRKAVWNGHGFDWVYTDKVAGETFNVTYNKSEDPNKCHRPSVGQLKDDEGYDMSNSQAVAFTQQNPEFLDSIDVAPEGYYLEDGACYPNPTETPTPTGVDLTPTPTDEPCRENCGTPPTFQGSTTEWHANVCNGVFPGKPIIIEANYLKTGPTSAHFEFWGVKADGYEVEFGYSKDNLPYGIPGGLPGGDDAGKVRGFDLNDLGLGFSSLFAKVTAQLGECYTSSDVAN